MSRTDVKCPYCGETMKIYVSEVYGGLLAVGYTLCPGCGSNGPTVKASTEEAVKRIYDDVKATALHRPLQKPLTLEDLRALIDAGDEVVTYCEAKGAERTYANIWTDDLVIDVVGYEHKEHVCFENYGKTWRAWAARPTDEERAAAQWED